MGKKVLKHFAKNDANEIGNKLTQMCLKKRCIINVNGRARIMITNEEILEQASNLCHIEWIEWSKNISQELNDTLEVLSNNIQYLNQVDMDDESKRLLIRENWELSEKLTKRLEKWERLWIPYDDLTEEMKEEDRNYARKILELTE